MRELALATIGVYQRYVSPYKGFCCAYRAHTGRASCSALGARVIRRHGVLAGCVLLRQRLRRCGDVHRQCRETRPRPMQPQRGECDAGGCDLPCDFSDACDVCDCCDCDWPSRNRSQPQPVKKRRNKDERPRWEAGDR